jgi:hypothetical protein
MIRLIEAKLIPSKGQWGLWEGAYFLIEVENLSYDKQVAIHFASGQEAPAGYVRPSERNRELWECYLPINSRYPELKFALKYAVGSAVYWDNNGGQDYQLNYTQNALPGRAA